MEKLPLRGEIDDKYKWRLEDIYTSDELWEKDFILINDKYSEISKFKGHLKENGENILKLFTFENEISQVLEKLFVYARMRRDEDSNVSRYQGMSGKVESLITNVMTVSSYVTPELLSIDEEVLRNFVTNTLGLDLYKFKIEEMLRVKKHILSEKEERIMAMSSDATQTGSDVFNMFNNADLRFPAIKDENGDKVELTKGRYSVFMESKNSKVRKDAFNAMYKTYGKFKNTITACLVGNIKSDKFNAEARNFESSLEDSLSSDNVPVAVYDNLINTVSKNLDKMEKYMEIRKHKLNMLRINMYDLYVPIVDVTDKKYSYEEAQKIILEALKPLGKDYVEKLQEAFNNGWIDVFENQGKKSGAYSWGCFLSHPYILLNWQGTINDIFTLAHELGHAMHSYYSNSNQPYVYADYKIFVAEVASTVNENLLFEYLIRNTTDIKEKAYLINHYLEEFRTTVFRQVMFAEFEKITHKMLGDGEALTCEAMCDIYYRLNKKYFRKHVNINKDIAYEWMRIPHFYTSFYVYKYATGFSSAVAISRNILEGKEYALDNYFTFLKCGGSNYPMDILKIAGVDLNTSKSIDDAMLVFEENLTRFKELA